MVRHLCLDRRSANTPTVTGTKTSKTCRKTWRCDCGNKDDAKIITALDGEVVCAVCGTVIGYAKPSSEHAEDQSEKWDEEADLCRKILEDRVSKKGWQF